MMDAPVVLDQGDVVVNERTGATCVIGWVDRPKALAYTAGHCGATGDTFSKSSVPVGTFRTPYEGLPGANDWGRIVLDGRVKPGRNAISGERVARSVSPGDTVCRLERGGGARCATLRSLLIDGTLTTAPNFRGSPGESGSPVWSAAGFVGIYTGFFLDGLAAVVRLPLPDTPGLSSHRSSSHR